MLNTKLCTKYTRSLTLKNIESFSIYIMPRVDHQLSTQIGSK